MPIMIRDDEFDYMVPSAYAVKTVAEKALHIGYPRWLHTLRDMMLAGF